MYRMYIKYRVFSIYFKKYILYSVPMNDYTVLYVVKPWVSVFLDRTARWQFGLQQIWQISEKSRFKEKHNF